MSTTVERESSQSERDLRSDLSAATGLGVVGENGNLRVSLAQGRRNLWFHLALAGSEIAAIRVGLNAGDITNVQPWSKPDGSFGVEFATMLGAMRSKFAWTGRQTLRHISSIMPTEAIRLAPMPRDLLIADARRERCSRSSAAYGVVSFLPAVMARRHIRSSISKISRHCLNSFGKRSKRRQIASADRGRNSALRFPPARARPGRSDAKTIVSREDEIA